MSGSTYYCKAGFMHRFGEPKCEHVVKTQFGPVPRPQPRQLPAAVIPESFYTEESLARRREENKLKYQPVRRSYHQERDLVGNEARELGDYRS